MVNGTLRFKYRLALYQTPYSFCCLLMALVCIYQAYTQTRSKLRERQENISNILRCCRFQLKFISLLCHSYKSLWGNRVKLLSKLNHPDFCFYYTEVYGKRTVWGLWQNKNVCSSDSVLYCFCLGTWKTTLSTLLDRSYDNFWWMSCEYKVHLSLLAWSNRNSHCNYSIFLFLCSSILVESSCWIGSDIKLT